ncbi:response regulator transcription factor [Pseudobacter ginsenosidimutans]|uniref:LuxR family two component transcriptional regulator n=1 Tax=Pseudobacter ginsenosidimutans TaxID=661488 RepID=A0A4Q7MBB7_9BACT|nr:response regulator transcription factor [Pseudobacter ginsenosidimutans]QEC45238.1 response regulator transcription factor [Pseudobacter ginsenosidimutans]RZS65505.1 LuxR family two component transcriptional regulator [Pseudobacter ginsenosidimutans]
MAIKVLVYDDNEALRTSIEALIMAEDDFLLLAVMPNAETVETDVKELQPDVVLMDIDMPVINGVMAVQRIRQFNQQLPVIMLTVFDDNDNIFKAICAGASGYLLKQNATSEIPGAIRTVMAGGAPMTGSVARKVLQMVPKAVNTEQEKSNLSEKETAILQLLVKGFSYKMIATELRISIDTVRFHIKKIYDKLHVHSATEAVSRAIRDKLV